MREYVKIIPVERKFNWYNGQIYVNFVSQVPVITTRTMREQAEKKQRRRREQAGLFCPDVYFSRFKPLAPDLNGDVTRLAICS